MSTSTNASAILTALTTDTGSSVSNLQHLTGLDDVAIALGIAELGTKVRVDEGLIYLATEGGTRGTRGQTKKCAARVAVLSDFVNELVATGHEFTAKSLMAVSNERWVYTDIDVAMKSFIDSGRVLEQKVGRSRTWKGVPTVSEE